MGSRKKKTEFREMSKRKTERERYFRRKNDKKRKATTIRTTLTTTNATERQK